MSNFESLSSLGIELPPYVPPIGVDMQRLGTIAGWGFFQKEVELTSFEGPTSRYHPLIAGFDGGKPIVGPPGEVGEAALSTYSIERCAGSRDRLAISLNTAEIEQRLRERQADLHNPKPWTQLVKSGLTKAMHKASREHLFSFADQNVVRDSQTMIYGTCAAGLMIGLTPQSPIMHLIETPAMAAALIDLTWAISLAVKKRPLALGRFSFFVVPAPHLDRYGFVAGLSKGSKLVKPLK